MGKRSEHVKKNRPPFIGSLYKSVKKIRRTDYPKWIASEGQTSEHVPHSVHISGLIEYLSPSEIAPTGHSSIQVPQAIQSSLIT